MKVSICQNKQKNGFTLFHCENFYIFFENKRTENTKKIISLSRSKIFPNKCYPNAYFAISTKKTFNMCKIKENTDMLVKLPLFHAVRDVLTVLEEKPQVGKSENIDKNTQRTIVL